MTLLVNPFKAQVGSANFNDSSGSCLSLFRCTTSPSLRPGVCRALLYSDYTALDKAKRGLIIVGDPTMMDLLDDILLLNDFDFIIYPMVIRVAVEGWWLHVAILGADLESVGRKISCQPLNSRISVVI